MGRFFLSLYAFIALTLFGLAYLLDDIIFTAEEDNIPALAIGKLLYQQSRIVPLNRDTLGQQLGVSIDTVAFDSRQWPKKQRAQLLAHEPLVIYSAEGQTYVFVLLASEELIRVTLSKHTQSSTQYLGYFGAFFALLAVALGLWVWPLWRDLMRLKKSVSSIDSDRTIQHVNLSPLSPLGSIAQALEQLADQVRTLLKQQRELTGAVAHEFRTPLARMKFALALADSNQCEMMLADVNELERLVQEMLDYASLESAKPELSFTSIPLKKMLRAIVDQFQNRYPNCPDISIHGGDIHLLADEHFIQRAVQNILGNALRYAKNAIVIKITCESNSILLSIEDDGSGIAEKDWQAVFDPFYRPDKGRDRRLGGAGLGLAIVKRILQWHKGSCYVEHSLLGGARFVLRFLRGESG